MYLSPNSQRIELSDFINPSQNDSEQSVIHQNNTQAHREAWKSISKLVCVPVLASSWQKMRASRHAQTAGWLP
jgi:hypothetical protein